MPSGIQVCLLSVMCIPPKVDVIHLEKWKVCIAIKFANAQDPSVCKLVACIPSHPRANEKKLQLLVPRLTKGYVQQVFEIEHSNSFLFVAKRQLITNLLCKIITEQDMFIIFILGTIMYAHNSIPYTPSPKVHFYRKHIYNNSPKKCPNFKLY